jgi:MFS family permease
MRYDFLMNNKNKLKDGGIARAFSSRNFRIFWYGHFSFIIGVWVNRVSIAWLTWELTNSELWLGYMGAASMVPMLFLGPLSGATADRYGHRKQLQIASAMGGLVTLILAIMVFTDRITPEVLLFLTFLGGGTRAFTVPARNAMVHSLVGKKDISAVIAVNAASYHSGNFIGPAIAGGVLAAGGVSIALFAYSAIAIGVALLYNLLDICDEGNQKKDRKALLSELSEGFRYAYNHEGIRNVMILTAVVTLFLQPYMEMMPAFATEVFNRAVDGFAILQASAGLGAMIGGLWLAQRGRTQGLTRILLISTFGGVCSVTAFSQIDHFYFAMAALFFVGISIVAANIGSLSLIQNSVDAKVRGRVMSLNGVLVTGGPALGAILIGTVAETYGVQTPVMVSALIGFVIWLVMVRPTAKITAELEKTD